MNPRLVIAVTGLAIHAVAVIVKKNNKWEEKRRKRGVKMIMCRPIPGIWDIVVK